MDADAAEKKTTPGKGKVIPGCAVRGCRSLQLKDSPVWFHAFPKASIRNAYEKDASNQWVKVDQRQAWLKAMKLKDVSPSAKVCSLHFREDDYLPFLGARRLKGMTVPSRNLDFIQEEDGESNFESENVEVKKIDAADNNNEEAKEDDLTAEKSPTKRLKNIAVPSHSSQVSQGDASAGNYEFVNIKVEKVDEADNNNEVKANETRGNERANETKTVVDHNKSTSSKDCDVKPTWMETDVDYTKATSSKDCDIKPASTESVDCTEATSSKDCDVKLELQDVKFERCSDERVRDVQVQVNISERLTCFSHLKSDSELDSVTGIRTFALLKEMVDALDRAYDNRYEIPGRNFTTVERVMLTFAKIKHDISHSLLAILFEISSEDSEYIFLETQERLRNCNVALPEYVQRYPDE